MALPGGDLTTAIFWTKNRGIMGYHFFKNFFNGGRPQNFWVLPIARRNHSQLELIFQNLDKNEGLITD